MRLRSGLVGLVVALAIATCAFAGDDNGAAKKGRGKAGDKGKAQEKAQGKAGGRFAEQAFNRLDANADGKVSKEEFEKAQDRLRAAGRGGQGGAIAGRLFDRLDQDKDGGISQDEFKKIGELIGQRAKGAFQDGKRPLQRKKDKNPT